MRISMNEAAYARFDCGQLLICARIRLSQMPLVPPKTQDNVRQETHSQRHLFLSTV